jgi:hypothetical protein
VKNKIVRPFILIGEAGEIALSGVQHNMTKAHAELGAEMLKARDTIRAAHDQMGQVLNVIDLWARRPRGPAT